MKETQEFSFMLPNGAKILATLDGNADSSLPKDTELDWSGIGIYIVYPDGQQEPLCAVDFEKKGKWFPRTVLSTTVYSADKEDYVFKQEHPYQRMSIWLTYDDDTDGGGHGGSSYDINIWDEDTNERYEPWEVGHIPEEFAALQKLEEIIAEHPEIYWERKPVQDKRSTNKEGGE